MLPVVPHLVAHIRLAAAFAVGVAMALLIPGVDDPVSRALVGWNVAAWLYLAQVAWAMFHADHAHVKRVAEAQAESIVVVLFIVIAGAVASLGGTVLQMADAKGHDTGEALGRVAMAVVTVIGSWLLVPTLFTLAYASRFHDRDEGGGLGFPEGKGYQPHYADFLYVAFTIAVASQTSDVLISNAAMRRLVLMQSVVSFGFNTAVLAFTINLAAGMV
ncbi:MAG: DUF1345 domain-containing protein [Rhizobacter sp.]